MLRSGRKGGVAIATPDGGEVRGGIAEAGAKMCASLNSDRLFGVVNNETETCVDEKGAPLGLKIVWEGVKNFRSCFIVNFCGIEKNMWHRNLRSTRTEGVYDWVIGVNDPPGDLVAIIWSSWDWPVREGSMKLIKLWGRNGALEIEVVLVDNVRVDGSMTAVRRKGYLTLQNLGKGVIGGNVGFEWGITGQRVRHASS